MPTLKELAVQATESARKRLQWTLTHVPDDKLDWSPAPTAKSALGVVAHVVSSNRFLAMAIRCEPITVAPGQSEDPAIATREDAVRLIDETTDAVVAAINGAPEDMEGRTVQTPFGESPLAFFIPLPARHMDGHASQIEYIQSCWGDTDFHWND